MKRLTIDKKKYSLNLKENFMEIDEMKVEMPPGEVLDRLAILFVILFLAASKDTDENIRFYKNFLKRMCWMAFWKLTTKPVIFKTYLKFMADYIKSHGE